MKITPGRWVNHYTFVNAENPDGTLNPQNSELDDAGERHYHSVARCFGPDAEANARAIAAVPELIETLNSILEWSESRDGSPEADERALRGIAAQARSALAEVHS